MEECSEAEEVFKGDQAGQCDVSNGGIVVPGPEDHCSNSPIISSLLSVESCS